MHGAIVVAAVSLLTATVSSGVLAQGVSSSGNATISPNQANSNLANITGSIPQKYNKWSFIFKGQY